MKITFQVIKYVMLRPLSKFIIFEFDYGELFIFLPQGYNYAQLS